MSNKTDDIDFEAINYVSLTVEVAKKLTPEQQRILKLEKRVADLEEQMLGCLRWMRYQAEKEAKTKDPAFPVQEMITA